MMMSDEMADREWAWTRRGTSSVSPWAAPDPARTDALSEYATRRGGCVMMCVAAETTALRPTPLAHLRRADSSTIVSTTDQD